VGTTDIAALASDGGVARSVGAEIVEARRSLIYGGDTLDRILLNVFSRKARGQKTAESQGRIWRQAALEVRASKEQLFSEGRAVLVYEGRPIVARLNEVTQDPEFKTFRKLLATTLSECLQVVVSEAARRDDRVVDVILAGGGAKLEFVADIVKKAPTGRLQARLSPPVPSWANAACFDGNLAPLFPQLCIAIGGAIAPVRLLNAFAG
jgi:molecular chaperone DnaK (HSP70)